MLTSGLKESIFQVFERIAKTVEISKVIDLFNGKKEAFFEIQSLYLFSFLLVLGSIISLMNASGAAHAYARYIAKEKLDAQKVELSSFLLSLLLFIDDYFCLITTGSVMKPLADMYGVPRNKLAFIICSVAAPVCALFPFSSWGATTLSQYVLAGINDVSMAGWKIIADPLITFLKTVPFIFNSWLSIFSVWYMVRTGLSFGPFAAPFSSAPSSSHSSHHKNLPLSYFYMPILIIIVISSIGILATGGWKGFFFLGENHTLSFVEAIKNAHPFLSMLIGSSCSLAFCIFLFVGSGVISSHDLFPLLKSGFSLMSPTIFVFIAAWTFASFVSDLNVGAILVSQFAPQLSLLMLPLICSLAALFISFLIGGAWATMALLFPVAVQAVVSISGHPAPLDASQIPILYVALGAIISGSVLGDHISPISDVTLLASRSTNTPHLTFIYGQMWYTLPVGFATLCATFASSLLISRGLFIAGIGGGITGLVVTVVAMHLCAAFHQYLSKKA